MPKQWTWMHIVYMCHKLTHTILDQDFWKHDSGTDNMSAHNGAMDVCPYTYAGMV